MTDKNKELEEGIIGGALDLTAKAAGLAGKAAWKGAKLIPGVGQTADAVRRAGNSIVNVKSRTKWYDYLRKEWDKYYTNTLSATNAQRGGTVFRRGDVYIKDFLQFIGTRFGMGFIPVVKPWLLEMHPLADAPPTRSDLDAETTNRLNARRNAQDIPPAHIDFQTYVANALVDLRLYANRPNFDHTIALSLLSEIVDNVKRYQTAYAADIEARKRINPTLNFPENSPEKIFAKNSLNSLRNDPNVGARLPEIMNNNLFEANRRHELEFGIYLLENNVYSVDGMRRAYVKFFEAAGSDDQWQQTVLTKQNIQELFVKFAAQILTNPAIAAATEKFEINSDKYREALASYQQLNPNNPNPANNGAAERKSRYLDELRTQLSNRNVDQAVIDQVIGRLQNENNIDRALIGLSLTQPQREALSQAVMSASRLLH